PDYAEVLVNLGVVLRQQGRPDEAASHFERALTLRPDLVQVHKHLGNALSSQGKFAEAAARFRQAIAMQPGYATAHNNLGDVLRKLGETEEAIACFERALTLEPNFAEAHNNLGGMLDHLGRLEEALASYARALALRPNYPEVLQNLATARLKQGLLESAAEDYRRALALRPDFPEAELGVAVCALLKGDYERGWHAYEARLRIGQVVPKTSVPRWRGEPLAGRTLLLVAEQGLGDTIQGIRYAGEFQAQGVRVALAIPDSLRPLLSSYRDFDEFFLPAQSKTAIAADYSLPLLSAPGALGSNDATIPSKVPYLFANADLTAHWRRELARIEGFRIGIAWQGSRDFFADVWRSIPLAQFAPLAALEDVRLVSLQIGFGTEQIRAVDFPLVDLADRLDETAGTFMDTAAVMQNLDLVVTSDTAIAHLAGALGVPVFVALQLVPDWRWQLEREDSPWYPTMRLFRQTTLGDWPEVFRRMACAVEARRLETA
ncbi:MAG TPA: tetratricopeptide repeat-containing glycosyltransferase family protein, partial [Pirellulales bacterium]|nr:tetratricopeptide repeat-containing glycosyltransferase family protein [Pirellulales bacterium]